MSVTEQSAAVRRLWLGRRVRVVYLVKYPKTDVSSVRFSVVCVVGFGEKRATGSQVLRRSVRLNMAMAMLTVTSIVCSGWEPVRWFTMAGESAS